MIKIVKHGLRREAMAISHSNGVSMMFQVRTVGLREQAAIAKRIRPEVKSEHQAIAEFTPDPATAGKLMHLHRPSRKNVRKHV